MHMLFQSTSLFMHILFPLFQWEVKVFGNFELLEEELSLIAGSKNRKRSKSFDSHLLSSLLRTYNDILLLTLLFYGGIWKCLNCLASDPIGNLSDQLTVLELMAAVIDLLDAALQEIVVQNWLLCLVLDLVAARFLVLGWLGTIENLVLVGDGVDLEIGALRIGAAVGFHSFFREVVLAEGTVWDHAKL